MQKLRLKAWLLPGALLAIIAVVLLLRQADRPAPAIPGGDLDAGNPEILKDPPGAFGATISRDDALNSSSTPVEHAGSPEGSTADKEPERTQPAHDDIAGAINPNRLEENQPLPPAMAGTPFEWDIPQVDRATSQGSSGMTDRTALDRAREAASLTPSTNAPVEPDVELAAPARRVVPRAVVIGRGQPGWEGAEQLEMLTRDRPAPRRPMALLPD